jgi:TM2 domain-containing membrane protein YozV
MDNETLKSQLTSEEYTYVNSELIKRSKSKLAAYLLWFFLGVFGAHRFYLGQKGIAFGQLALGVLSLALQLLNPQLVIIPMGALLIWLLVDAFLIYRLLKNEREKLEREIIEQVLVNRSKVSGH